MTLALRYRPSVGNLADTIPHFHQGEYHIFYLRGSIGKVPWEHLVTTDFLHWQELTPALLPDGDPEGFDGCNMFTGCVVEHAGLWRIFYTGWNSTHPRYREFVCQATSTDGVTWTKHPELAFTADGLHYDLSRELDFRDPYVFWNEEEKLWWMLLCARRAADRGPVTGLAVSRDLLHWEQRAPVCGGYEGTPECPDIFCIDGTWYLLVSPCDGVTTYRSAPSLAGPWSAPPGMPIGHVRSLCGEENVRRPPPRAHWVAARSRSAKGRWSILLGRVPVHPARSVCRSAGRIGFSPRTGNTRCFCHCLARRENTSHAIRFARLIAHFFEAGSGRLSPGPFGRHLRG